METLQALQKDIQFFNPWHEAKVAAFSVAPVQVKFQKLQAITSKISEMVSPKTACRNGCSYCCYQAVSISEIEAKAISKFIGKEYTKPNYSNVYENRNKYRGVACPFLKNGKCGVYEQRPLICRTHINLSQFSEICKVGSDEMLVPYLDTTALDQPIIKVCGEFNDIRHWFPKENENEIQS